MQHGMRVADESEAGRYDDRNAKLIPVHRVAEKQKWQCLLLEEARHPCKGDRQNQVNNADVRPHHYFGDCTMVKKATFSTIVYKLDYFMDIRKKPDFKAGLSHSLSTFISTSDFRFEIRANTTSFRTTTADFPNQLEGIWRYGRERKAIANNNGDDRIS